MASVARMHFILARTIAIDQQEALLWAEKRSVDVGYLDPGRRRLRSSNTIPSDGKDPAAVLGKKGGMARAKTMTPERWDEIEKKAAVKRWEKDPTPAR